MCRMLTSGLLALQWKKNCAEVLHSLVPLRIDHGRDVHVTRVVLRFQNAWGDLDPEEPRPGPSRAICAVYRLLSDSNGNHP